MGIKVALERFADIPEGARFVFLRDIERMERGRIDYLRVFQKTADNKYSADDDKIEYTIGSNQLWIYTVPDDETGRMVLHE